MTKLGLAFRAFFRLLSDGSFDCPNNEVDGVTADKKVRRSSIRIQDEFQFGYTIYRRTINHYKWFCCETGSLGSTGKITYPR